MSNITVDRIDGNVRLIIRLSDDSIASTEKIIGESQARQLLDLTGRLVDPVSSYIELDESVFIDNEEYNFVFIEEDLYRFTIRASDTVFIRYDFDRSGLEDFDSKLRDVINIEVEELGAEGPPVFEGLSSGVTGPIGPVGATGPAGVCSGGSVVVTKGSDQVVDDVDLVDDADLFIDVGNDSEWVLEFVVFDDASSGTGLKFEVCAPEGSVGLGSYVYCEGSLCVQSQFDLCSEMSVSVSSSVEGLLRICLRVVTGLSGVVALRWCKGFVGSDVLTFKEGSYLVATRVR